MSKIYINTDGGSRGNPGEAAIGVVFADESGKTIYEYRECLGIATNNEAEYKAIIKALQLLKKSRWFGENNDAKSEVICRLDSKLVVEQVNGNYKVKQDHIALFNQEIKALLSDLQLKISFNYVPREENKLADKLVNLALDQKK